MQVETNILDLARIPTILRIHHILASARPQAEELSLFQGFAEGLLKAPQWLHAIAVLPRDLSELFLPRNMRVTMRMLYGGYAVKVMRAEFVAQYLTEYPHLCSCVWSTSDEATAIAEEAASSALYPVLFVNPEGMTRHGKMSEDVLCAYAGEIAQQNPSDPDWLEAVQILAKSVKTGREEDRLATTMPVPIHYASAPNYFAMAGAGFRFDGPSEYPTGSDDSVYLDAIARGVNAIRAERAELRREKPDLQQAGPYQLIVAAPSMFKHINRLRKEIRRLGLEPGSEKVMKSALREMSLGASYRAPADRIDGTAVTEPEIIRNTIATLRQQELELYSAILAVRASSNFVPVFSLPPVANDVADELGNLLRSRRARGVEGAQKRSRVARQLSEKLTRLVPAEVIEHIRDSRSVKLISDVPLEWISVDGLPLMLHTECSRIPTTQGDVFLLDALANEDLVFTTRQFEKVLVIRSFKNQDPIREELVKALEWRAKNTEAGMPEIVLVDVSTEAEFIAALEAYDGVIMVYDGHAYHDSLSDHGLLRLSGGDVDPWNLREKARIPPIVILSACETQALGASHATVANSFRVAGAHSVIATTLPINARSGAQFVASLLNLMRGYFSMLSGDDTASTRWSSFVSGVQRRRYCNDVLDLILGKDGIRLSAQAIYDVLHATGSKIATRDIKWFTDFANGIATASGVSLDVVQRAISREAYHTDTLSQVQIGNPDRILIYSED